MFGATQYFGDIQAMSFLDNLKLTNKSLVPLLCMALLFAGVVAFGAVRLVEMGRRSSDLVEHADPAAARGIRAARAANQVAYDVYRVINYEGGSADAKAAFEDVAATAKAGDRFLDEAAQLHPAKAAEYAAFRARLDAIVSDAQGPLAVGLATPGLERGSRLTPAELDAMAGGVRQMVQVDRQITIFVKDLVAFNEALIAENKSKAEALNRAASQAVWSMVIVGLLAILAGVATSIWMTLAKITRPLGRLGERMETLAGGDLGVEVEGQGRRDEIGAMARTVQVFKDNALKLRAAEATAEEQRNLSEAERRRNEQERAVQAAEQAKVVQSLGSGLAQLSDGDLTYRLTDAFAEDYEQLRADFNGAMDKLQKALGAVVAAGQGISSGTGEISQAADDLSRRTEQQAASLEETAAALDQITATVKRTAEGAAHATEVVTKARADGERSGDVVQDAVAAMTVIAKSAQQISQIIGVIDEIAFQTNLLALNAGVEAARAGDAGRGFAVVASEVRALAQRSAEAAKEIKTLISASTDEVAQGVQLVGAAGQALERIVVQVVDINTVIQSIAASAQEQATGLQQINTAVNQMDQMTQQNAAMVEESNAASHGLAQEAGAMVQLMAGFRTGVDAIATSANDRTPSPQRARGAPVQQAISRGSAAVARKLETAISEEWAEF